MSTIALHSTLNILETVTGKGLIPNGQMAYGESNDYMTDDITWTWKVKCVTQIHLERNISKTAGDRDSIPKNYQ